MRTTTTAPTSTPTSSGPLAANPAHLTAAAALAVVLILSGCGSPDAEDPTPTSTTAPNSDWPSTTSSVPTTSLGDSATSTPTATGAHATASTSAGPQANTATLTVPAGSRSPKLRWSDTADPDTIAATFVAATWQMDTSIDTSPTQAQQRAAQLGTESLSAALARVPVSGGGAAWSELVSRSGWTSVEASATSTPDAPDGDTECYRLVSATITAHGQSNWTSTTLFPPVVVYVSLVPDGASWRVEDATTYSS